MNDELKQLKSNDSSIRNPEETFSREKNNQMLEIKEEEPVIDEEDFIVEERITYKKTKMMEIQQIIIYPMQELIDK